MWELSRGRYTTRIDAAGTGFSRFDRHVLSAFDPELDCPNHGFFLYVRDTDDASFWSPARRPTPAPMGVYGVHGDGERVRFEATCFDIESTLDVWVGETGDHEARRLRLRNRSSRPRRLEVTSCIEVVLHEAGAHAGHPAFSKLFVQTENADGRLLARRRPRSHGETHPWLGHALLDATPDEAESDRARFVGRGRGLHAPRALTDQERLSGTFGNVLDPLFSLRRHVELAPGAEVSLTFVLAVAATRSALLDVLHRLGAAAVTIPSGAAAVPPVALEHGYSAGGREYSIALATGPDGRLRLPPMPWVNVIANPDFGCIVSETGAGCTWSRNSRENRLTPWSNDPVRDPHGEALYVRDDATGEVWSPQPGPKGSGASYRVHHGFGYSRWEQASHALRQSVVEMVPPRDPVKVTWLTLTNEAATPRRLSLFSFRRLVLGASRAEAYASVSTSFDAKDEVLYARNPSRAEHGAGVTFAAAVRAADVRAMRYSGDGSAFRDIDVFVPDDLDGKVGDGLDPCAALQVQVEIPASGSMRMAFLFGEGENLDQARDIVRRLREPGAVPRVFEETRAFWSEILSAVQVRTPLPEVDALLNGWLLYQTLSCRLWGRSAFYQSGGAFGFRDQLQDSCALLQVRPDLTRAQILLHAAHQFVEGDVLHWWHPPGDRGTRTRFSDDLLWLPYLTSTYIESSGDMGILDEVVGYVRARTLEPGEDETYLQARPAEESADLFRHCCLAIDRSLAVGAHGLPLMGTGDWNDGMNRVGREGRGESVWVGFFLYRLLDHFLPLCRQRGEEARAQRYAEHQERLRLALEEAWDGDWYRRAYYDDGSPLGSAANQECRIDALAQAWSVLSGAVRRERAVRAMQSVDEHLISWSEGMVRLLTPAFDADAHDPGYIKGYVRGIRENGGQYTHAALWVVQALARLGRRDEAAALFERIGPSFHAHTPERLAVYQVEPYVVAADIYGEPPHVGRGGWTWYTGSAAWMYRVGLETILGITLRDGTHLRVEPCLPDAWPQVTIDYKLSDRRTIYTIRILNPDRCAARVRRCSIDGGSGEILQGAASVPLRRDGRTHVVEIEMGA